MQGVVDVSTGTARSKRKRFDGRSGGKQERLWMSGVEKPMESAYLIQCYAVCNTFIYYNNNIIYIYIFICL